jgi:hypothetical protein
MHCQAQATNAKGRIKMSEKIVTWVVYLMTVKKTEGIKAVCEQSEWDAMEIARPGYHHLIRAGIASEVEAEAFARGEPVGGTSAVRVKGWTPRRKKLDAPA